MSGSMTIACSSANPGSVKQVTFGGYSSAGVGISRAGVESLTGVGSAPAKLYVLAQHMPKVSYDENNYAYIVRAFR